MSAIAAVWRLDGAPLDRLLDEARNVLALYVRPDAIRRAHRQYIEHGTPRDVHCVWRLATLTLRLRRAAL